MSEPFVGEIRMFAGNFAPRGWALCDGQLLAVSQNDALFSLLGTIYGGDGRTTFGLPDLRGRIPVHAGTGPGLSQRRLGAKGGAENVTLTTNQLPPHRHNVKSLNFVGDSDGGNNPDAQSVAAGTNSRTYGEQFDAGFSINSIGNTGGSRSHDNIMPSLCINYIIALVGIYPSRT
jgi:microcystin-dependent protein